MPLGRNAKGELDMSSYDATKLASYLAHPFLDLPDELYDAHPHNLTENEIRSVYSFLRKNRVILRTMDYLESKVVLPRKMEMLQEIVKDNDVFAKTRSYTSRLVQRTVGVLDEISRSGIEMIFIKSFKEIPFDSHNYDILFRKADVQTAKKALENCGFKEYIHLNEPFKWFYRRVYPDLVLSIHLHTGVAWEGVKFVDEDDLWLRHRRLKLHNVEFGFPSSEHSIIITVAHAFFENRNLKLCDLLNLAEAFQTRATNWSHLPDWPIQDGWSEPFYIFLQMANYTYESLFGENLIEKEVSEMLKAKIKGVQNKNWEKVTEQFDWKKTLPLEIPTVLVARSYVNKVLRNPGLSFIQKTDKVLLTGWHYSKNRFLPNKQLPSFLICFSGQDGTGKTMHAKHLYNEVEEMIHLMNDELMEKDLRVNYVWSRGIGSTIGPLMGAIRRVLLARKSPEEGEYEHKRERLLTREPMRSLWAYFTLIDEVLQLQIKVRFPLLLQQTVISDRYIQDAFIDAECDLKQNVSWVAKKIITDLVPKPRLVFITNADPNEIQKRRKIMKFDVIECKRQKYLSYLREENGNMIDTAEDFGTNSVHIFQKVLETLMLPEA